MLNAKKALICDWLDVYSGAERCIAAFTDIYKDFDIYSLVDFMGQKERGTVLKGAHAKTSYIQNLPFSKKHFRLYLPLFANAIESFDLSSYDIVLSSSHCVAKNALTNPNQLHISYLYTPTRYAWDMHFEYLARLNPLLRPLARKILHNFRIWDASCANRPDKIIAISQFIAKRVAKIYGKKADVIYPPVDTLNFKLKENKDDYYITCGRLVGYKRVDLLVKAFNLNGKKLVIVGDGEQLNELKAIAKPNIELLGRVDNNELKNLLQNARGFVYAGIEDFGIAAVEAMSCGTPVIAFNLGGVSESVKNSQAQGIKSGMLFNEQNETSLNDAIKAFESDLASFEPAKICHYAQTYSTQNFKTNIQNYISNAYTNFKGLA